MKYVSKSLLTITLFMMLFQHQNIHARTCIPLCLNNWSAAFRIAYFSPSHDRLRDIYSPHWVDYQLEIANEICPDIEIWSSVGYIQRSGESTFLHEHTRFRVIPIGLGIKAYLPVCSSWKPYAGIGFNFRYLNIHNSSDYVKERIHQWKCGSTLKLGVKKTCCNGIFYDVFFDYILQNFRFSKRPHPYVKRNDIHFDGWKIGAGIGYAF